jgi:hypothetical protein
MNTWSRRFRLLLLAGCLAAAGCDSILPPPQVDPTRYYVLSGGGETGVPAAAGTLRLGLRTVDLAGYLQGRPMVVRHGANELLIEDFHRWAEPLGDGVARAVRARLQADPAVGTVALQPFAFDAERDYDVAISVLHCEGSTVGDRGFASFAAVFEIRVPGPAPRVVARRVFVAPDAAWDGRDFGQLASLLSNDVDALGNAIAAALPAAP